MMGREIAEGLYVDAGVTGWVFAKHAPPHAYGRRRAIPMTSGLTRMCGGRVRGFSRRRHRRDRHRLPELTWF